MKRRIRLGISSMPNSVNQRSQSRSSLLSSDRFLDLPVFELDDMFNSNLRVLTQYEENSNPTAFNQSQFQSSLNVYISSQSNPRPSQKRLAYTHKCSSYESLYDNLISGKKDVTQRKDPDYDIIPKFVSDNSTGSIDDYLQFGSNVSLDSDQTIKSFSSNTSSSVSSIDNTFDMTRSNQSLPTSQIMYNEVHLHTQLRSNPDRALSRPISYHQGDSMGYYYSSKPPSHPFKKDGRYAPANVVISRSHVTPSLTANNLSRLDTNHNMYQPAYISDHSSTNNIPNNNYNSNIVNNQPVFISRSSSSQILENISRTPPIISPRDRMKTFTVKAPNKIQSESMPPMSETIGDGSIKSSFNLILSSDATNTKSNGMKLHPQIPNYDNEFSYPDSRTNCISYRKSTEIHRINRNV